MLGLAGPPAVLADAATVALTAGPSMSILMSVNTTFTAPTNKAGFSLTLTQDATGSRTGTFPASFLFVGGSKTLTTTANGIDEIDAVYSPTVAAGVVTDRWLCTLNKAYA